MSSEVTEPTRRDHAERLNRVMDHIQDHLGEPLDLEGLASVACFSPFHFHRIFRAWTGETLQQFVHRLRLERAAQQLVFDPLKPITDIALDCGFSGSSPFARDFRKAFGMSASHWRKIHQLRRKDRQVRLTLPRGSSFLVDPMVHRKEPTMRSFPLDVQVRNLEPATLAYLRHLGPYMGDAELFRRLFTRLFAWAGPRGLMGPDTRFLSLYQDNPNLTPEAHHRLEVALTVPPGTAPDGDIGVRPLEGGRYACLRARIRPDQYAEIWDALCADWLPGSGFQPDDRVALEWYHNDPQQDPEGMHDIEICMPVRAM